MKTSWFIKVLLFLFLLLFAANTYSQDLELFSMIGKDINTVIKKYGKPVHQDRSNPQMECVFYKTKTAQRTFVANTEGVFQAEGAFCFKSYSTARKSLSDLISISQGEGYRVDTLNNDNFVLYGNNAKVNLSVFENTLSKEYEIKVKAQKAIGIR